MIALMNILVFLILLPVCGFFTARMAAIGWFSTRYGYLNKFMKESCNGNEE